MLGQHAHAGQVDLAFSRQGGTPDSGHGTDDHGRAGQPAGQGIFGTTMDDALRGNRLDATDGAALEQGNAVPGLAQACQGPESGDAAAEYCNVEFAIFQTVNLVMRRYAASQF